jgi:hypothetical protein
MVRATAGGDPVVPLDGRSLTVPRQQEPIMEPRTLPPETIEGLSPPLRGFRYLAYADRFRFEPDAARPSAANAWWLADASFLVYGEAPFVEEVFRRSPLPNQGFRLQWLGTPDDNRGMVLASETALLIVFRGTRVQMHSPHARAEFVSLNPADVWSDSQFVITKHAIAGRVHSGFLRAFAPIADQLDAIVHTRRPEQNLWLTGHSLGGALATLAAAHLGRDAIQGLYTYGCPRVGDAAFAEILPQQSHVRFVHRDDWVTTVPPEILGYVHAGAQHQVTGSEPRSVLEDLTSAAESLRSAMTGMLREQRFTAGLLPFTVAGLADHAPVYYATLLWNALLPPTAPERLD